MRVLFTEVPKPQADADEPFFWEDDWLAGWPIPQIGDNLEINGGKVTGKVVAIIWMIEREYPPRLEVRFE